MRPEPPVVDRQIPLAFHSVKPPETDVFRHNPFHPPWWGQGVADVDDVDKDCSVVRQRALGLQLEFPVGIFHLSDSELFNP